jgi:hypothetical protein
MFVPGTVSANRINEVEFTPIPEVLNFGTKDWEELSEEAFRKIFKSILHSAGLSIKASSEISSS